MTDLPQVPALPAVLILSPYSYLVGLSKVTDGHLKLIHIAWLKQCLFRVQLYVPALALFSIHCQYNLGPIGRFGVLGCLDPQLIFSTLKDI